MKKAFIPKSLRPDVVGSTYNISNKKEIILKNEINIGKILDLNERSKIIRKLFKESDYLSSIDAEIIEELKSCLIKPSN